MAYNVGLTGPYDYEGTIQNDFFAAMALFYANRAPLVTRLPNLPTTATQIKAVDDAFRPKSTAVNDANSIDNAVTTVTVDDGSFFLAGDVIQVENELMLIASATATTVAVSRGHAGTTAAAHNDNTTVYLVANTRTGAEVDQSALTRVFDTSLTYPQTVQHPYQIGGSLEASSAAMALPGGFASMVGYQRAKAAQEVLFDFERACYYGRAVALAADTTRPMMRGIRQRLTTNLVTSPTNASAYKPSDLQRDLFSAARSGGGEPNVLVVSNEFQQGFFVWGVNLLQVAPSESILGINVSAWRSPDLGDAAIVFSPLLRPYTAFALTADEVYMAWKREPRDKMRGSRGDADEGDIIGEGCIVVNNEAHHAWVEGITGWAKQS